MPIEATEMLNESRITLELSHCLNNAVKMMIAHGSIGKVSDFAVHCGIPYNVVINILNHRTIPDSGQLKSMIKVFYELSRSYAYAYFVQSFLGVI